MIKLMMRGINNTKSWFLMQPSKKLDEGKMMLLLRVRVEDTQSMTRVQDDIIKSQTAHVKITN